MPLSLASQGYLLPDRHFTFAANIRTLRRQTDHHRRIRIRHGWFHGVSCLFHCNCERRIFHFSHCTDIEAPLAREMETRSNPEQETHRTARLDRVYLDGFADSQPFGILSVTTTDLLVSRIHPPSQLSPSVFFRESRNARHACPDSPVTYHHFVTLRPPGHQQGDGFSVEETKFQCPQVILQVCAVCRVTFRERAQFHMFQWLFATWIRAAN